MSENDGIDTSDEDGNPGEDESPVEDETDADVVGDGTEEDDDDDGSVEGVDGSGGIESDLTNTIANAPVQSDAIDDAANEMVDEGEALDLAGGPIPDPVETDPEVDLNGKGGPEDL